MIGQTSNKCLVFDRVFLFCLKYKKNKLFLLLEQARLNYVDYFLKVGEKWKIKK